MLALALCAGPASALPFKRAGPRVLPDVPVTAQDLRVGASNNSPTLAADPTDSRVVVLANRIDGPTFGCSLQVSVDGGRTWAPAAPVPVLPSGAQRCYAPQVAFGPSGRLYFLFAGLAGAGNAPMGEFLTTSSDQARSFSTPTRVLGPEKYMLAMAMDRTWGSLGRLHLAWVASSGPAPLGGFSPGDNPILAAHSDDGGRTFSTPVQVSDPARQRVVAPALALGPDHRVDVLYYDLRADARDYEGLEGPTSTSPWSLVLATSIDGGRRFATRSVVDASIAPPGRVMLIYTMAPPALVVDPRGRTFAAWTDARSGAPEAVLRRSTDGGRTWGALLRLDGGAGGDTATRYLPHLSVAPDGRIDAVWLDRRRDPSDVRNDTYYTSSGDGGVSFAPGVRLTAIASDSKVGPTYLVPSAQGLVEFGSRLALHSTDSGALAAWPDTSNSPGATDQDIYATEAQLSAPAGDRGAGTLSTDGWAIVVGLAAAGGAGAVLVLRRKRRAGGHAPLLPAWRRRAPVAGGLAGVAAATAGMVAALLPASVLATPTRISVVEVTMVDYAFHYRPPPEGGRVVFVVRNAGGQPHEFNLERLPVDFPLTIDQQLHGTVRRAFPAVGYLPPLAPGRSDSIATDLGPGRYAVVSFARAASGPPDALRGMATEFRIATKGRP
ncbi:MAG: hypothetical protein ACRDY0_08520 [Acidimicrobiales bacterium]